MNLVPVLKRCEVFVGLSDNDLENVASLRSWQRRSYNASEFIFHRNAKAKDFYILEEGQVSLIVELNGKTSKKTRNIRVDTITKGDVFGWSSLVVPSTNTMSAVCDKPSTILAVSGAELTQFFDHNRALGYEVMKGLVRVIGARWRDLYRTFVTKDRLPQRKGPHLE